jgi:hypothetical protein
MRTQGRDTVPFGELVAVAFDKAAEHTSDPAEVSRLATSVVMDLLRRARIAVDPAPGPPHRAHAGAHR